MLGGRPEDWRDMSEAGEGPGPIPHATVQASLAQRAYAADAPLLYAVWKAAVAIQQTYLAEGVSTRFSRMLNAMFDVIHGADHKPADPAQPCPHCATAERDAQTWQQREAESRAHGNEARAMLAQVIEQRDAAERERDAARADLATLQAGLDGLRTWAHGVKGASK